MPGDDYLSFKLHDEFIDGYAKRPVDWGYPDAGGNTIGEITFFRTYSRLKESDGQKEHWHETCRRVIEGTYSILKDWCSDHKLPWSELKAQHSAQEAYERMFTMKWLPPGRGLWMMGTRFVNERRDSSALQNCAFVSTGGMTRNDPERPFTFLMEASMLGVGVGFDTKGNGRGIVIHAPEPGEVFVVPDDREGWVESVGLLLRAFLSSGKTLPSFDYSLVRPAGSPIVQFGGTAAGHEPLQKLHEAIVEKFKGRKGDELSSRDIVDLMNFIGQCVVAGNVRRSAELALGDLHDEEFLNLKNYEENPERGPYGWVSNNSVSVNVGDDYSSLIPRIRDNGEPGLVFLDVTRSRGRLDDAPDTRDARIMGFNPCAEQPLESYEMCTLAETFPTRCDDMSDFLRTQKFAFLYAKAVTLYSTVWPETNAVMQRNRRIGDSATGLAEFVETRPGGWLELINWLDAGYKEVRRYDTFYSEWLGVRESVRVTTVKPSGSVSLLAGVTPGVHWPVRDSYIRRIRMGKADPLAAGLKAAGYKVEGVVDEKDTVVVEIPVQGKGLRTEREVSLGEKAQLAALAQRWWSDNGVSVTLTFDPKTEADDIAKVLEKHEGQLKAVSFLPMKPEGAYKQMPYESITPEVFEKRKATHKKIKWAGLYRTGEDAVGEKFCTTDVCDVFPVEGP